MYRHHAVLRCLPVAIMITLMLSSANGQDPAKLINEKNDLQRRLNGCEAKSQALENGLQQLRKTHADQTSQVNDLQNTVAALRVHDKQSEQALTQARAELKALEAAKKQAESLAQSRLVQLNALTTAKLAVEGEREDCQKSLTGLREVHAKVVKEREDLTTKIATLRTSVADLEVSHAEVVKQSTDGQDQLNACHAQLEQARAHLRNNETEIAALKKNTAEREWVLTWLRHRFPGTFGNEFNIENIVETLGGRGVASVGPETRTASMPVTRSVAGYEMGYLLLRMADGGDVQVGGVPVSSNGQLYRLVSVPMSHSPRTVSVQANGYDNRVDIQFGQVVMFDCSRGVYLRQSP